MKKLFIILLVVSVLSACSPASPEVKDPNAVYTEAAKTVFFQMTQNAALTPSATATLTPVPTATATLTPEPSPTSPPPTPTWEFNAKGKVIAPILLYNRIEDNNKDDANYHWESKLNVPPALFRQQMQFLKENGYTAIPLSLLVTAIREGAPLPPKPVVITFDVGAVGIYKKAFPIMKEMGFVGTVFLVGYHLDAGWMMTSDQAKEMAAAGWEIGSRGLVGGIDLTAKPSAASDEISKSRLVLEEKLGVPVKYFSYPYGKINDVIGSRVAEWGYLGAVGIFNSSEHAMNTIYYLARYEMRKDMSMEEFASRLPWKPEVIPTTVVLTPTPAP